MAVVEITRREYPVTYELLRSVASAIEGRGDRGVYAIDLPARFSLRSVEGSLSTLSPQRLADLSCGEPLAACGSPVLEALDQAVSDFTSALLIKNKRIEN